MIKVLCVEDHYGTARLIQLILQRDEGGFEVIHAAYLKKALEIVSVDQVDIILLDLNLPDSHGIESIVQIRSSAPQVPVIVMTGIGDDDLFQEAIRQGASDFLIKGNFEAKYLSEKIIGVMDGGEN